jgi:hypothetical protein
MLGQAYALDAKAVKQRFLMRKLYDLRGRIVHSGTFFLNLSLVIRYMETLYTDMLFEFLGIPSNYRAGAFLDRHRTDLVKLFGSRRHR